MIDWIVAMYSEHSIIVWSVLSIAGTAYAMYMLLLATWLIYIGTMALKRVRDESKLHPFAKVSAVIVLLHGLPIYIAWNLVGGTLLFLELPREIRFTERLKRHKAGPKGWRNTIASWLCEHMLNQFDPSPKGHC